MMGSPCGALAPARRAFQLQTAVRRLSPKDPPPLVQGAALGAGRKASFFLFLSQKERSKEKCSLRKGLPPSVEGGRGAAPGPRHPLKRVDGNFTGLRPQWLRLQVPAIAFYQGKAGGRVGRDTGGTPAKIPDSPFCLSQRICKLVTLRQKTV